ncbi:MAG: sensor histidine kinase [Betaproteobacteria bacterium]|nr:sensor histidine kinase [Betaproteobacteria bacterium]
MLRGWRWLMASTLLNTLIALALTLTTASHGVGLLGFGINWLYSQCIGLAIWGLIDIGRLALTPDEQRQWRRLFGIVPAGVVLGYLGGTLAADTLLRKPGQGLAMLQSGQAPALAARASARAEAAQRQAAESQLKLLQTQLEPHMLFNTLANLRVLVGLDPARAQTMLDHLIAYLRATLGASRATQHPLQDEFDRLADYLALMAVRMGPRLAFSLDLPDDLRAVPVPPLLLQPLVENSIRHGLEPKVAGGSIHVQAQMQGSRLFLAVTDTGLGCDTTAPPATTALTSGFGLTQVRERLHTCYGAEGAIEIVAMPSGGTRVSISFPLNRDCPLAPRLLS